MCKGVVELREDVPLKSGGGDTQRCAGPRLIATAFAVLTVAITLALLTQIYYGDYEVVPHGSVSTSVGACSRGGAALLRARGSALDAAAAAALCLALAAPYDTALDASGALLYWEYRRAHDEPPTLAEWGAVGDDWQMAGDSMPEAGGSLQEAGGSGNGTVPRLVAALAGLHVRYGMLPWAQVLQPAIDYAESSEATTASGAIETGVSVSERVKLLREWQRHTSAELCAAWRCSSALRVRAAAPVSAGAWRAYVAGAAGGGAGGAAQPLRQALLANSTGVLQWLREAETDPSEAWRSAGASSGLAVVDPLGTYVALVAAVSQSGASDTSSAGAEAAGAGGAAGWRRDAPRARLDVAPALIVQQQVCGTRYVVGAGSWSALVQCTAQWAGGAAPASGVRAPRLPALRGAAPVNLVREQADALLSHADARAGPDGLAARF